MIIEKTNFGQVNNEKVYLFKLTNTQGTEVKITNYGGIITSLKVKDKSDQLTDVVLGFDKLDGYFSEEYKANNPHFGGLVGRYANRIANGEFELDGNKYTLAKNNGDNSLHGGPTGFDVRVWDAKMDTKKDAVSLILTYKSKDMEEGFPGNLDVSAVYTLRDDNTLSIDYSATTDKKTIVNLTNHSYFNLNGEGNGNVLDHVAEIYAPAYTPVDEESIPTGEIKSVEGTPFDFRTPHTIGERNSQVDGRGYDHNFVLDNPDKKLKLASKVVGDKSGIVLEVLTTEPGIQFYIGNYLDGTLKSKKGGVFEQRGGFCFEPQVHPDSPNQKGFPNCVLNPGETYIQKSVFKFSVKR